MLNLKKINQNYKQGEINLEVLSDLDLHIDGVKNIGIIGPSGSGKSSLLNIIGLIETPKSGEFFFNGKDCLKLSNDAQTELRKKYVGYIFQNNQLLEDFSVYENIAMPLILNGKSYKVAKEESLKFLSILGLQNKKDYKPGLLSGGEQQRVAIARALIKKPLLVLADEPTGSLDKTNSNLIMNLIIELSKNNNSVSIIATHNLEIIKKLDLCYRIEKGKLVEFKE
mgnify:CR=1 FL=1